MDLLGAVAGEDVSTWDVGSLAVRRRCNVVG